MPTNALGWLFTGALVVLTFGVVALGHALGGWWLAAVGVLALFVVVPWLTARSGDDGG